MLMHESKNRDPVVTHNVFIPGKMQFSSANNYEIYPIQTVNSGTEIQITRGHSGLQNVYSSEVSH